MHATSAEKAWRLSTLRISQSEHLFGEGVLVTVFCTNSEYCNCIGLTSCC